VHEGRYRIEQSLSLDGKEGWAGENKKKCNLAAIFLGNNKMHGEFYT